MAGLVLDSMKFSWFSDDETAVVVGLASGAWQYSATIQELSCSRRHFFQPGNLVAVLGGSNGRAFKISGDRQGDF